MILFVLYLLMYYGLVVFQQKKDITVSVIFISISIIQFFIPQCGICGITIILVLGGYRLKFNKAMFWYCQNVENSMIANNNFIMIIFRYFYCFPFQRTLYTMKFPSKFWPSFYHTALTCCHVVHVTCCHVVHVTCCHIVDVTCCLLNSVS